MIRKGVFTSDRDIERAKAMNATLIRKEGGNDRDGNFRWVIATRAHWDDFYADLRTIDNSGIYRNWITLQPDDPLDEENPRPHLFGPPSSYSRYRSEVEHLIRQCRPYGISVCLEPNLWRDGKPYYWVGTADEILKMTHIVADVVSSMGADTKVSPGGFEASDLANFFRALDGREKPGGSFNLIKAILEGQKDAGASGVEMHEYDTSGGIILRKAERLRKLTGLDNVYGTEIGVHKTINGVPSTTGKADPNEVQQKLADCVTARIDPVIVFPVETGNDTPFGSASWWQSGTTMPNEAGKVFRDWQG